ncbi:Uncharacterized protein SCF082_LOCUS49719 [Durusdinium trenchii]|uniref:Uncharacterized protein n=1 Tax=Durusdinium trenchii TaxID=1381693 RepID=A0ABP0S311_9DINO
MSTFCPHLDEIPDMFTTFWQRLHSAVLQLEREFALDAQAPGYEIRALCVQLAFLRSIVKGQAGLPFPRLGPHGRRLLEWMQSPQSVRNPASGDHKNQSNTFGDHDTI